MIQTPMNCSSTYYKRKKLSLCVRCENPTNGTVACESCSEKKRLYDIERGRIRLENDLCTICGKNKIKHGIRCCEECISKWRIKDLNIKKKRIENGLCRCGNELSGNKFCDICLHKSRNRRNKIKNNVFEYYGNKCKCCGETRRTFLTIDHINDDGASHRKIVKMKTGIKLTGIHMYKWLCNNAFPKEYQILCWNCQYGKRNGGCPHQKALHFESGSGI